MQILRDPSLASYKRQSVHGHGCKRQEKTAVLLRGELKIYTTYNKQSQKSRSNRISGKDDFISLDLGKMNLILRSKMTNSDRIVDRSELEMNLYKQ